MNQYTFDGNDDLGLAPELNRQVSGLGPTTLTVEDVRGRAGRIRRHRRLGAAAGAAAVVAIAVPVMLWGQGTFRSDAPPPIGQSPSTSQASDAASPSTPTPTGSASEPTRWTVAELPTGAPPAMPYLDHAALVVPGVEQLSIDPTAIVQVRRLGDGRWLIASTDQRTASLAGRLLAPDGGTLAEFPMQSDFVTSRDGLSAVWTDKDGRLWVIDSASDQPRSLTLLDDPYAQATAATGDCAESCRIYVSQYQRAGGRTRVAVVDESGTLNDLGQDYHQVLDVGADEATLTITDVSDEGTCSAYSSADGSAGWGTCDHLLRRISPTGA